MKNKTLAFAFRGNISEQVLNALCAPVLDKVILSSSEKAIAAFVERLDLTQYNRILGLGMYGGPDKGELRVEVVATSQFRNQGRGGDRLRLPSFVMAGGELKEASAMGNSYCNLVSYQLARRLMSSHEGVKFSFIHIPKSFPLENAVHIIDEAILANT